MRWRCLILAAMATHWFAQAGQCEEFPYTAYVNSSDVYVRSGPGKNYYPTDKLQKGEKVEVYRHDPGGWYAIRPPQGSFSWVSTRHLDLVEDGIGAANSDRIVVRVGSSFSKLRDVIQVRLERGEKVEVLETTGSWYKIAPPSGEFRWIYSKYVEPDETVRRLASDEKPDEPEHVAGEPSDRELSARELADEEISEPVERDREVRLTSAERIDREVAAPTRRETAALTRSTRDPERPERFRPDLSTDAGLQQELDEIDLELSVMVAEEVTVWSFDELRQRTEAALDAAQTALARGRVRVLLNKLERFEDIKRRHDTVTSVQQETDRRNRQLGSTEIVASAEPPKFDGVGRLRPVASRRTGLPPYALVDDSGAVVTFLSPAPGVNLQPYKDKQVGVVGHRSFNTDLKAQQINVQRVTLLEPQRR